MSKQDKIKYLLNASAIAWKKNDAEEVVKLCTQVTEIDPQNVIAYSNIGTAYWAMLKPNAASPYFSCTFVIILII